MSAIIIPRQIYPLGLLIAVRDKAQWVERAARAALDQVCRPIEIILSDQGSTDGTREILDRVAAEYRGPHKLTRLDCPLTDRKGMAGLNAHLEWAIAQTECEAITPMSGDDFALPGFAKALLQGFDEHPEAVMVGTSMSFVEPGQETKLDCVSACDNPGWISVAEHINHKVGGSTATAFKRDFWRVVGPVPGICGVDLYMPAMAAAFNGFWFIKEPLYAHVWHKSENNMGLGGVMLAAGEDEARRIQIMEHIQFQIGSAWQHVLGKLMTLGAGSEEDRHELAQAAFNTFCSWADVRLDMTLKRIEPRSFPI